MILIDGTLFGVLLVDETKMEKIKSLKENKTLVIAIALSILLIGGLVFLNWKKYESSLIHHLKEKISQRELSNLKINHAAPISHQLMTGFYGARLLCILALASFLKNQKLLILSALFSGLVALKLYHTSWILFQRTFYQSVGLPSNAAKVEPHFFFMIPDPSKMIQNDSILQETLHSIYDYTTSFFKNSKWNAVRNNNRLEYNAKVLLSPLTINNYNFIDLIQSWGGSAYFSNIGSGSLEISPIIERTNLILEEVIRIIRDY